MAKLNLLLLVVLVICALGLVTSQHQARKKHSELEHELARAGELEIEYGQLRLEASTWGLHSRVERIAVNSLHMRAPDPRRVRIVARGTIGTGATDGTHAAPASTPGAQTR